MQLYNILCRLKKAGIIKAKRGKGLFVAAIPDLLNRKLRIALLMKMPLLTDTTAGLYRIGFKNSLEKLNCDIEEISGEENLPLMLQIIKKHKYDAILFIEDGLFEHISLKKS